MAQQLTEKLYIVEIPSAHENEKGRQVAFRSQSEADRLARFFRAASCRHHKYNLGVTSEELPIYSSAHTVLNDLLDELAPVAQEMANDD
jgi:hypothetical protein